MRPRALLALAAQVEQRVVDADGKADQQDTELISLVHGDQVADDADEAERGGDGA